MKKLSDCDVYKGMNAKFTACCAGFPKPDMEWFKDGNKLLLTNSRFKVDYEDSGLIRLTIYNVNDDDIGTYKLKISNKYGEADCSAKLICDCK